MRAVVTFVEFCPISASPPTESEIIPDDDGCGCGARVVAKANTCVLMNAAFTGDLAANAVNEKVPLNKRRAPNHVAERKDAIISPHFFHETGENGKMLTPFIDENHLHYPNLDGTFALS